MAKYLIHSKYHRWPESIDIDSEGNLYFTDVTKSILYRIKRKEDNSLADNTEVLLKGFSHTGGISIKEDILVLGVAIKRTKKLQGYILQIPIAFFIDHKDMNVRELDQLLKENPPLQKHTLEMDTPKPNGVVFDSSLGNIFYTYEHMIPGILRKENGHLVSVKKWKNNDFLTPNGLDLEPLANDPALFASLLWKNEIIQILAVNGEIKHPLINIKEEIKDKTRMSWLKRIIGPLPDGVLCLEKEGKFTGILVAAWLWGSIIYIPWQNNTFGEPKIVVDDLRSPTDLAIGPSTKGSGKSLFVTTMLGWTFLLKGFGGQVIEIPNFQNILNENRPS